jgi:hypothetical protein
MWATLYLERQQLGNTLRQGDGERLPHEVCHGTLGIRGHGTTPDERGNQEACGGRKCSVNKLEEIRKGMDRYKEVRNEFKTKFEREKENPKNQNSLILLYSPPLNSIARETFDSMIEMDILSIIEEKDKALQQYHTDINNMRSDQQTEMYRYEHRLVELSKALEDIATYPPFKETNNGYRFYEQMREIARKASKGE